MSVLTVRVPGRSVLACLFLKPQPLQPLWAQAGCVASLCRVHGTLGKRGSDTPHFMRRLTVEAPRLPPPSRGLPSRGLPSHPPLSQS